MVVMMMIMRVMSVMVIGVPAVGVCASTPPSHIPSCRRSCDGLRVRDTRGTVMGAVGMHASSNGGAVHLDPNIRYPPLHTAYLCRF